MSSIPWQQSGATATVPVQPHQQQQQPRLAVPRRQKRVIVTSCDICRLRKLRCNAKDLPQGTPCSQCTKSKAACTFEDFKESIRPLVKMRPASNDALARSAPTRARAEIWPASSGLANAAWPAQVSPPPGGATLTGLATFGHSAFGVGTESLRSTAREQTMQPDYSSYPNTPAITGFKRARDGGGEVDDPPASAPAALISSDGKRTRRASRVSLSQAQVDGSGSLDDRPGPWAAWNLPTFLTHPVTGCMAPFTPFATVSLLLDRFYCTPTIHSIVLPYEELFSRLEVHLARCAGGQNRGGNGNGNGVEPLPEYLLLAVLSVSAASAATREPELKQWWKQHGWKLSMTSINTEIRNSVPVARIELIQALLLVGIGWTGEPESVDRMIIFETAVKVSFQLKLNSSRLLDAPISKADRAKRVCLYWFIYVVDKLVAVATSRPAMVLWEQCNMPMLSLDDMLMHGSSNLTSQAFTTHEAQDQQTWLHHLALAFISLAKILEDVQQALYPLSDHRSIWSTAELQQSIMPYEEKLVGWCQSHRDLIREATGQGGVCRCVTEAVVAQLHLAQIQLYQLPLRFEFDLAAKARAGGSPQRATDGDDHSVLLPGNAHDLIDTTARRIQFSSYNDKALTACIESGWHLIQQSGSCRGASPSAIAAMLAANSVQPTDAGPTSFAMLRAAHFFRFLSAAWDGWDAGQGLLRSLHLAPLDDEGSGSVPSSRTLTPIDGKAQPAFGRIEATAGVYATGTPQPQVHSYDSNLPSPGLCPPPPTPLHGLDTDAAVFPYRRRQPPPLRLDLSLGANVGASCLTESCLATSASLHAPHFHSGDSSISPEASSMDTTDLSLSWSTSPAGVWVGGKPAAGMMGGSGGGPEAASFYQTQGDALVSASRGANSPPYLACNFEQTATAGSDPGSGIGSAVCPDQDGGRAPIRPSWASPSVSPSLKLEHGQHPPTSQPHNDIGDPRAPLIGPEGPSGSSPFEPDASRPTADTSAPPVSEPPLGSHQESPSVKANASLPSSAPAEDTPPQLKQETLVESFALFDLQQLDGGRTA